MSTDIGKIRLVPGLQNQLIEKAKDAGEKVEQGKFSDLLGNMINSVNGMQQEAAMAQEQLAAGEVVDLHQVMIAVEKAGISMDLLLEIRNRLVDGYNGLIKMPM